MSDRLLRESDVIEAVTQYISSDYSTKEMAREDAELLIGQIPSADRPQEWIPCSERMPEEDGYYLITLDFEWGREIEIGLWTDGEWFNDNRHANIAWMPMIEPWEGADDER